MFAGDHHRPLRGTYLNQHFAGSRRHRIRRSPLAWYFAMMRTSLATLITSVATSGLAQQQQQQPERLVAPTQGISRMPGLRPPTLPLRTPATATEKRRPEKPQPPRTVYIPAPIPYYGYNTGYYSQPPQQS